MKATSTTYAEGGDSVQINLDGKASGYGTVLGTLPPRRQRGAPQEEAEGDGFSAGLFVIHLAAG